MQHKRIGLYACALVAASVAAIAHCGNSNNNTESTGNSSGSSGGQELGQSQTLTNEDASASSVSEDASAPVVQAPPALGPLRVVAGPRTEIPANLRPTVRITAPRANATVRGTAMDVRLDVRDWPAPEGGRHVHLILDNGPYIRIDNPGQPHHLEGLTPGTHTLRAFPGWSTHESIKRDGAFAIVTFNVERRSAENNPAARQPLLTYSRPKGSYLGADADRILLDWYLTNVPALSATGFRVRYSIDGTTTGEMTEWAPHYIENLPDGTHTITLDLLGANGQPVAGPFNHAERQINVNRAGSADGGHGPGAHDHSAHAHGADAGASTAGDAAAHGG
jgi:hypothetical protein